MIINHNMASLNTYNKLNANTTATAKSLEKLSSGLRINKAGDDAAGLAISEKMRGQIRGLDQASRNAQDGISLIQTAEGSLSETQSILQRMKELATQAANDTNVAGDRTEIQKEMNQLSSEINRIGNTTEFNTQKLLKGTTAPVIETAAKQNTVTAGVTGIAAGAISDITQNSKSVKAISSDASVQASTSAATGAASSMTVNTASIAGKKSTVTLNNGITFSSVNANDTLNNATVELKSDASADAGSAAYNSATKTYTITVGNDFTGTTRGALQNYIQNVMDNAPVAVTNDIALNKMDGAVTGVSLVNTGGSTFNGIPSSNKLLGGVTEQTGSYAFDITEAFEEAGDTVKIGGQTFTAKLTGADATKGEFNVGDTTVKAVLQGGNNANILNGANLEGGAKLVTGSTDAAAVFDTGALAGTMNVAIAAASSSNTLSFNGFTLNITTVDKGGAATDGAAQITAYDATAKTATIEMEYDTTAGTGGDINDTATKQAAVIANAFKTLSTGTLQAGITSTAAWTVGTKTNELKDFAFTTAANGVVATANTAGDQINNINTQFVKGGAGALALTNTTFDNQFTAGRTNINTNSNVVFSVNGTNYKLDSAALVAAGALDGTVTKVDMQTLVGNAVDTSGNKLSTVGVVSFNGSELVVTSNTTGLKSQVGFTVNDGSTSGSDKVALERAFGLTSGNNSTGMGTAQAASLAAAVNANKALSSSLQGSLVATSVGTKVTLNEVATKATGTDLTNPVVAGSGTNDKLLVKNLSGQNLNTITILQASIPTAKSASADAGAVGTAGQSIKSLAIAGNASLDGIKIDFTGITGGAGASTVTSTWNTATRTLSLAGNVANASAAAATTDIVTKIKAGLTAAGIDGSSLASTSDIAGVFTGAMDGTGAQTLTLSGGSAGNGVVAQSAGFTGTNSANLAGMYTASGKAGIALNGVTVKFTAIDASAGGGTANKLTSSWDAASRTLSVTGTVLNADNAAAQTATIRTAVETGLKTAGFDVGSMSSNNLTTKLTTNTNEASFTFGGGSTFIASSDTLTVDQNNGDLTVYLAGTTATKNSAANIQSAVQALGKVTTAAGDVDLAKYNFTAQGDWDSKTTGNSITSGMGTLVGGTKEVKGEYTFDVTKAFAADDLVNIKGYVFKAVSSASPDIAKGEFDISGDLASQTANLVNAIAINKNISDNYDVSVSGTTIKLLEKEGSGVDLTSTDLKVAATGTQGQFKVSAPDLLVNGAKFVLDGQEILVSNKNEHVGYTNGTAIKEATSVADQTKALAEAINKNATLKVNYTASVGADGSLVLNQNIGSSAAPVASTKSSDKGNFTSTFQVGANSGQSMKIDVEDMRSAALGITGDGSAATVKASNGSTASYVSTANVTDGTTDTNSEFALDVSTHEKATAAIGVLDDAIAAVSAQRSQLGAFQNRLEHTITNLGTSSENLTGAESRIRDVDMAKEMMQFQKNNILAQAATAMLAQANQQPQGVLQLLR